MRTAQNIDLPSGAMLIDDAPVTGGSDGCTRSGVGRAAGVEGRHGTQRLKRFRFAMG